MDLSKREFTCGLLRPRAPSALGARQSPQNLRHLLGLHLLHGDVLVLGAGAPLQTNLNFETKYFIS
jgi:hypothetical protein